MRRVAAVLSFLVALVGLADAQTLKQVNTLNPAAVLSGSELIPLFQNSLPLVSAQAQCAADAAKVNPYCGYNASGSVTTTTGTISASSKTLTVASASGWSVGMGIAVANAGTGGNTELISSVTACSANAFGVCQSTTFTLNNAAVTTATGQTVNHDDTAALSAAITAAMAAAKPLHLQFGNYNVTSGLTALSSPITIDGDGAIASCIWNRGKASDVFTVNYQNAGLNTGAITVSAIIRDFCLNQASGITPTAGSGFKIASASGTGGGTKFYVYGLQMSNILMQSLWTGITTGDGVAQNVFANIRIANTVSGCGINYASPQPSGDNNWDDIQLFEINTGLCISKADTQTWTNLKLNGSGIVFSGASAGAILRQRFANTSIEGVGGAPSCAIDFGANGATQIEFRGGEIGGINTPLCHGVTAGSNVTGGLSVHMLLTDGGFNAIGTLDVETGLPTSCSGLITGRIANVSGVMTVCP